MPLVCGEVTNTIDYGADLRGTLHWGIDLKIKSDMNRLARKSGTLSTDVTVVGMSATGSRQGLAVPGALRHLRRRRHARLRVRDLGLLDL